MLTLTVQAGIVLSIVLNERFQFETIIVTKISIRSELLKFSLVIHVYPRVHN